MFLPHPGCEAEQVSVVRGAEAPLATIRRLRVQGSWAALLTWKRYVPCFTRRDWRSACPGKSHRLLKRNEDKEAEATIGSLIAHAAILQLPTDNPKANRLTFPKLALRTSGKQNRSV